MKKSFIIFFSFLLTLIMLISPVAFAANPQVISTDDFSTLVEKELAENQTSVVAEIDKMITEYIALKNNSTDSNKKVQLSKLIDTLIELRNEYLAETTSVVTYRLHPIYAVEVASVIAYFNLNDYRLSAELLTHMKENKTLDSEYIPLYDGDACKTQTFKDIATGQRTSGSDVFPNSGGKFDKDLYYAIHAFTFTKSGNFITISDRYDFASDNDYSSIAGVAINKMYKAQQDGYLTPFKVKMYLSFPYSWIE